MTVLLTRPVDDNVRIAQALEAEGVACLVWPLTRIVAGAGAIGVPAGTEALLFTSANAVRVFADGCAERGLPVFTVGDRTAEAAREAGFGAVTSARGDARDLTRLARATRHRRFLHPRGRDSAADLAELLAGARDGARDGLRDGADFSVEAPVIYAAEPAGAPPPDVARAFGAGALDLVTVWSPRNAAILRDWLAAEAPPLGSTDLLGISDNAVAPLRDAGFRRIAVAARPEAGAMLRAIRETVRR